MSYNKTNWQTGDTITADKLNNMEGGIEAATPIYWHLTVDENDTVTLPLTWEDISDGIKSGQLYIFDLSAHDFVANARIIGVSKTGDGAGGVEYIVNGGFYNFIANSEDDYPTSNIYD